MKKILSTVFFAAILGLAGCDGSSDPAPPRPDTPTPMEPTAQVQVIHASSDSPAVNASVGGPAPPGSGLTGLAYGGSSGIGEFTVGTFSVMADAVLPDGTTTNVIAPTDISFAADTRTIIIALGDWGAIQATVLVQPVAVSGTNARVNIVHADPAVGTVDIYVTAPGADLTAETPAATLAFGEGSGPIEVPGGDYQARITPEGDPATVVYDSGTTTLAPADDLVALAVPNTAAGASSPVSLLLVSDADTAFALDANTLADINAINASPEGGVFDVKDSMMMSVTGAAVGFQGVSGVSSVDAGTYSAEIAAVGDPTTIASATDITLTAGTHHDAIAMGLESAPVDDPLELTTLLATDDRRRVATDARVRVIHGSPAGGDVDVYVVPTGTDITTATPVAAGISFLANSGFLTLDPGTYDIAITVAGDATMVAASGTAAVAAGGIYTAIAVDAAGGGAPVGLLLLDDWD